MIQYSNPHEYQILQQYAASLGNTEIQHAVAANQAMTAADVRLLAQLYWYIVDTEWVRIWRSGWNVCTHRYRFTVAIRDLPMSGMRKFRNSL